MGERPPVSGRAFFSGDDRLEGILEWPDAGGAGAVVGEADAAKAEPPAGGVVIAHPHPLYGGTMAQPVVYRTAQACRENGIATLRFNFRGVGDSAGTYSGTDEYRDVEAAAVYLKRQLRSWTGGAGPAVVDRPLALAGYSFGSVMAAMAAGGTVGVAALALIAFVVGWEEMPPRALDRLAGFDGPVLAVCGDRDELAPPQDVERVLSALGLNFAVSVVRQADHFFEGRHLEVAGRVALFLGAVFAGRDPLSDGERSLRHDSPLG